MSFNPYAPPTSPEYGQPYGHQEFYDQPLATLGSRFVAKLLDGLVELGVMIPGIAWLVFAMQDLENRQYSSSYDSYSSRPDPFELILTTMGAPIALMLIPALAITIYQWVLITKSGQTLGKRWMNIRIMKQDGQPVDFVSGVILRNWVMNFLANIPYIGACIALVDILFIFSDDRQCLHDKIAKTKVVAVMPGSV